MPIPSRPNSASRSSRVIVDVSRLSSESQRMVVEAVSRSTTSKRATVEPADVRPVIAHISSRSAGTTTSTDGQPVTDPTSESTSESESDVTPRERWVCRARYLGKTCDLALTKTTYGFGHTEPRRWAHSPLARRL